jgi:hypothetical protein
MVRKHLFENDVKKISLIDMFLKIPKLHIFRAAEPSLRIRWRMVDCHAKNSMDDKARCGKRKMESLVLSEIFAYAC